VQVPVIALYKDPRGKVFSDYRRARGEENFQAWYPGYREQSLRYLRSIYNNSYLSWKNNRDEKLLSKVLCISLEELCLKPAITLEKIFHHVGLQFSARYMMLKDRRYKQMVRAEHISPGLPFEYQKGLTKEQILLIEKDFAELEDWFYRG
jgi:hypothetical protein